MAPMPPIRARFRFPKRLTRRRSEAAFSGVSEAGVVPVSMGVAPSGACRASDRPLYRSVLLYYLKSRRDRILTASDWAMERTMGRLGFGAG